ncbi:MAG: succinyldiaminopimelate transaminase [Microbacteriaceae bacterium]|nr:succinyldiaminopimelate transaminase [Microbacteriaceae bacterium]
MEPVRARAMQHPDGLIDLSIGSPVDPTPDIVRAALNAATDAHAYPLTSGTPDLSSAIVAWFARRRGVTGLNASNVLPTIGSKEFVAWLPFMLGLGDGDVVVHPRAAYPTYEIGATIAGATAVAEDDPADWPTNTKLVWVNSPGNPDGAVRTSEYLRACVRRARELGAILVSDECYAELGWDAPWDTARIPSLLADDVRQGSFDSLLCAYSLSKQSNMAGYRASFVAGCSELIAPLTNIRRQAGMMVPQPVQHAMAVALGDDTHVAAQKEIYRARRNTLKSALESAGFRIDHSEAGLYLWATEGKDAWESLDRLASHGIVGGPGHFYGTHFPQHIRLSLTATDERINSASHRLLGQ